MKTKQIIMHAVQRMVRKSAKSVLVFLVTLSVSCENLLEVDMPGNQIDGQIVFNDIQTANAAMAGLYAGLYDNSPLSGDTTGALLGYYTDDLDYFYTSTNANAVADIYLNQQVANNSVIESYWNSAYQKIYMTNAILEGVRKSTGLKSADKNRITGEALLVRSVLYYYLEEIFGSIPYVTSTDYAVNRSLPKTAAPEVLLKLEEDLTVAVGLLEDSYTQPERIYPNRKVAQLMLAKVYCLQNKWEQAQQQLQLILQSPLYAFQNDLAKVFDKSGPHILWQLKPLNPDDPTKEVQLYYFAGTAPALNALTSGLITSFSADDLRKEAWTAMVTAEGNTWYRADKYKNRTVNPNEYSVVFRLAEVFLLQAEVLAQQGKTAEAEPFLNKTRARAGLPPLTGLSKAQLLNEILQENRNEFFTEMGHRFLDLKRLKKLDLLTAIKPNWQDYHSLWPIPQKELLLNGHLNPQNSGY